MSAASELNNSPISQFNLETMSGVFPGVRTPVFQRVRLVRQDAVATSRDEDQPQWAQILWFDGPPACVVQLQDNNRKTLDIEGWPLRIEGRLSVEFEQHLAEALEAAGLQMRACGTCRFWQRGTETTVDALPLGTCRWQLAENKPQPFSREMLLQSYLALDCDRWQLRDDDVPASEGSFADATTRQESSAVAEDTPTDNPKPGFWRRLSGLLGKSKERPAATPLALDERSGVGAGTEPCFVCQGRVANLGALTVQTPEGDKQTVSVWRCRLCFTTYANNWIDRWERLDTLETEETYYRLSPAEALQMLALVESVPGGDHPGERHLRTAERSLVLDGLAHLQPLSHQIKQGR